MSDEISQSHIKLVSTPNAGLPGEHSPYYRKLISSGYKGYLQGTIGGATLYGVMGAVVGAVAGLGFFMLNPAVGGAAFFGVPLFAGYGVLKGATTFGNIGSNAAQLAEFAETNERRRALLDRLGETKSVEEAKEIQKLLQEDGKEKETPPMFHWKTVLIGAALGAAVAAGLMFFAPYLAAHITILEGIIAPLETMKGLTLAIPAVGALFGAATGAMIGLDRHYVRRWMDGAENVVHDQQHYEELSIVREHEASKLETIAKSEELATKTPYAQKQDLKLPIPRGASTEAAPKTQVQQVESMDRVLAALKHAPAV